VRWLIALFVVCAIGRATAAPGQRVVLVDPDPELRRALTSALQPWKLELIVDTAPIDAGGAPERADSFGARFVVWRRGKDLVVFDRERGDVQHREAPAGALDPVDAASVALTVKTLMRLPPPPEEPPPPPPVVPVVPARERVRLQAGVGLRVAHGSQSAIGVRTLGAIAVRPISDLRLGVLGEVGSGDRFSEASFKGTWSDWAVLGIASWTIVHRRIEIEPFAGVGLVRSHVEGTENGANAMTIDDAVSLLAFRGGGWVRYRRGMWSVGASISFERVLGTPTYTRTQGNKTLYEVPSSGATLGAVVAADLGK